MGLTELSFGWVVNAVICDHISFNTVLCVFDVFCYISDLDLFFFLSRLEHRSYEHRTERVNYSQEHVILSYMSCNQIYWESICHWNLWYKTLTRWLHAEWNPELFDDHLPVQRLISSNSLALTKLNFCMTFSFNREFTGIKLKHFVLHSASRLCFLPQLRGGSRSEALSYHLKFITLLLYD